MTDPLFTGDKEQGVIWLIRNGEEGKKYCIYEYKPKRSLDSNSYFHVLCDKLRQALGMSMARCKNHLIADYGQIEYLDDDPIIYKTNAPEDRMMELETPHTKCVLVQEENGRKVYFYRVYRGSHTYNSQEMAQLIDGAIRECEEQGIETATPDELARMAANWGNKYDRWKASQEDNQACDI